MFLFVQKLEICNQGLGSSYTVKCERVGTICQKRKCTEVDMQRMEVCSFNFLTDRTMPLKMMNSDTMQLSLRKSYLVEFSSVV